MSNLVFNGGNADLFVVNSDPLVTLSPIHLTDDAAVDTDPVFSPNGKKVAFTSDRDGNFNIYKMNADGSSERRLTKNKAGDLDSSFSPNGKKIAFMSGRDGISAEIFVMNAKDDSRPRNITKNPAADFALDWRVVVQ